jgi:hypothetical protein
MVSYAGHQLELSIVNYLQSLTTVSGSSLVSSSLLFVTGYDNVDLDNTIGNGTFGGICKISVERDIEVPIPGTRNYEFTTNVQIIESAADTSGSMLGVNAMNVAIQFGDPKISAQNFTNPAYDISCWYVQYVDRQQLESGDLLNSQFTYTITGALIN